MKKVLFVVTSHGQLGTTGKETGYYLPELVHPFTVLATQGIEVDIASPQGGKAPVYGADAQDEEVQAFLKNSALQERIDLTLTIEQVKPEHYQGIFYVGGHGTMWDFPNDLNLAKFAAQIYEQGGFVAAVCHGPAALLPIVLTSGEYLIQGKKVTGFSNEEEDAVGLSQAVPFSLEDTLKEKGGMYSKAEKWQPHVVIDGRVLTGQNPGSARGVGVEMLKIITQ